MGHDISAYKQEEIAYLRRNMWSKSIRLFYKALNAEEHYAGVSGGGGSIKTNKNQILDAINYIKTSDAIDQIDKEEYVKFLEDTLEKGEEPYTISFY